MSVCNCYFSPEYDNSDYANDTWYQCMWLAFLVLVTLLASFIIAGMTSVDVSNNRDACYMWCDGALLPLRDAPSDDTPRSNHNNQKCMWANQFCEAVQASCIRGIAKKTITTRTDLAC